MPESDKMLYLLLHLMMEEGILTKEEYSCIIKEMEEAEDGKEVSKRAYENAAGDEDGYI